MSEYECGRITEPAGKKVNRMNEFYYEAINETHTAIEVDALSEEQLYRRLSESFDAIAIPRSVKEGR